ncbi:T9SS type A sorting domain-containing protein [Taibaiella koreensis]|uniref:T9SS type A sorting domain-containing protein n=1 Tax=Taibaiella koreensis TaxID=1268548 RepID=UPI000E59CDC1|nr:T9SS type A sorting domain-containing protein [Taibaiella koreensis]
MKTLYMQTKNLKGIRQIGIAAALMLLPGFAQAQRILAWQFANPLLNGDEATVNSTSTDPHLSTSVLSRVNAPVVTTPQQRAFMSTNFTQTTKGDQGFIFNITPAATYKVSLSNLSYKVRNSGSIPAGSFRWQYSLDGVNFIDIGAADITMPASTINGTVQTPIDLTGIAALQNVTSPITMRLVAWNLSSNTAMFGIGRSITNDTASVLTVEGSVVPSGPLPVQLQSFMAVAQQNDADLSWKTAMEKNSSYFTIERSSNGKDFTGIGKISSKNEANGARYTYTDAGALLNSDHQYYRLQSVDKDGTATYSNVVRVNAGNAIQKSLLVYPNPATNSVTIETNLDADGLLQVFNTTGHVVAEYKLEKAFHKTDLNTTSFAKGIYLIKLQDGQQISTQQLIVR